MVLGKLPVAGCPTYLEQSRASTYKLLVLYFAKRQTTGNKLHGSQLLISLTSRVRDRMNRIEYVVSLGCALVNLHLQ